ncbi:MAG: hypothetical protein NUV34_10375 [Sulfuricaulis sp.]|nr:hypothetical protein [Sulfuricaulis sp.]
MGMLEGTIMSHEYINFVGGPLDGKLIANELFMLEAPGCLITKLTIRLPVSPPHEVVYVLGFDGKYHMNKEVCHVTG